MAIGKAGAGLAILLTVFTLVMCAEGGAAQMVSSSLDPLLSAERGGAPAAPSGLRIENSFSSVSWVDNSHDEQGFRLTIVANDATPLTVVLPPNTNRFSIPSDVLRACGNDIRATLVAFNEAGDSVPAVTAAVGDCAPQLPSSGSGSGGGVVDAALLYAAIGASAALGLGGVLLRRRAPARR